MNSDPISRIDFPMQFLTRLKLLITVLILSFALFRQETVGEDTSQLSTGFSLKYIVIDPGHGGRDPGCVSQSGVKEKDITLSVSRKLAEVLRQKNEYEVFLTRADDRFMSLRQRVDFANQESFPPNQSIFLSLHCNSFKDQRIHGMESFKFDLDATDELAAELVERENAQESVDKFDFMIINLRKRGNEKYTEQVARILQKLLVKQLGVKNRNLHASRNAGVRGAPFYVLAWTKMPSVLLELGFISNDAERKKMTEEKYQDRIASALAKGIKKFDQQLPE